jgi:hypothetical protein
MPFDPSTASPVHSGFDPSTATLAGGFNPATARTETDDEFLRRVSPELFVEPQRESFISRKTGGAIQLRGDAGFAPASTGFAPAQVGRFIKESPELQAMGVRMSGGIPGAIAGAELGMGAGPWGSLVGSALGGITGAMAAEPAATTITPRIESPGESAANVLQWAIPGGARMPTRMGGALLEGAIGAGQGQIYANTQALVDQGRLANAHESAMPVLFGAGAGGLLGGLVPPARPAPGIRQLPSDPRLSTFATEEVPSELGAVGDVFREAAPLSSVGIVDQPLPVPTSLAADELGVVGAAMREAAPVPVAPSVLSESASAAKIRALGERMMGKSPTDQLAILDQELNLQKGTLSVAEQRAGLDMKQELKRQIEAQKAMEEAARAEQKAVADQQKAVADAQKAQAEAMKPPEMPKSAQILAEPASKPPALANVATEVATQTKNSPYALQGKLNEMTMPASLGQEGAATPPLAGGAAQGKTSPAQAVVNAPAQIPRRAPIQPGETIEQAVARLASEGETATAIAERVNSNVENVRKIAMRDGLAIAEKSKVLPDAVVEYGRAPVETDRVKVAADRKEYDALQEQMRKIGFDKVGTDEFNTIWQKSEDIKNRHGGMPPATTAAEPNAKPTPFPEPAPTPVANANNQGAPAPKIEEVPVTGRPPAATKAASTRRQQRGAVSTRAIAPVASAGAGGATGWMTAPPREADETDEEYQARRFARSMAFAAGGGIGAPVLSAASRLRPSGGWFSPKSSNPSLQATRTALTAKPKGGKSFVQLLTDAKNDFVFRLNTQAAPIGSDLQRPVYEAAGKKFEKAKYYDLEDRFEDLSGAQVKAQQEAEPLYNLVRSLPGKLRPRLAEYLFNRRVQDRLERIPLETQRLQDSVGIAQAELDAANAAFKASRTQGNAKEIEARKLALTKAVTKLNEEADRLRVAGWSIDGSTSLNPVEANNALLAELGPEKYQAIEDAAEAYQILMRENLRKDYEAGFLEKGVYDAITGETGFYSPFKLLKYYEDDQPFVPGGGRRTTAVTPEYKAITGIDDEDFRIANPLVPSYEQLYKSSIKRQKNEFLRRVSTLTKLDPNGDFIRVLPDGESPRKDFDVVGFWRNGEKVRMEIPRSVADVLNDKHGFMSVANRVAFLRGLTLSNGIFKFGATAAQVPFLASNFLVFDPARAAIMGKYGIKNPVDFAKFFLVDYPVGLATAARTSFGYPNELGEKWLKSGAAHSTFNQQFTPEAFEKQLPGRTVGQTAWDEKFGAQTLLNLAARLGNTLESTPKIASLRRALAQKNYDQATTAQTPSGSSTTTQKVNFDSLSKAEQKRAMEEISHEIRNYAGSPDFSRMGADMPLINILMPFTNARWQGFIADAGRLADVKTPEGRKALARLSTLVAFPAAGLMWWNLKPENRDDYEKIPVRERNKGFFIPLYDDGSGTGTPFSQRLVDGKLVANAPLYKNVDGQPIRQYRVIPKREAPQVAANMVEGFVRWSEREAPEAFAGLGETMIQTGVPMSFEGENFEERMGSAAAGLTPPVRLPLEISQNRDFFRRRDLVPESMVKAAPEEQYLPRTPQVYRDVAAALPDDFAKSLRSPIQLQKIAEDLTGGFVRQFTTRPDRPDEGFTDRVTSRFSRSDYIDDSKERAAKNTAVEEYETARVRDSRTAKALAEAVIKNANTPGYAQALFEAGIADGTITAPVAEKMEREIRSLSRGLGREEQTVADFIPKGARARYYALRLSDMTGPEGDAYIKQQVEARLLDGDVMRQLIQLNPQPKAASGTK